MKKAILIPILAAFVIAGGLLIAHARTNDLKGSFGQGRVLARIAKKLQLTADQRTQIKNILVADKVPLVGDLRGLHQAHIQLREAIQADHATEASVRAAAAGVATAEADLAVERLKLHNEIFPLLTPEQKEKAGEMEDSLDTFVDGVIDRIEAGLSK